MHDEESAGVGRVRHDFDRAIAAAMTKARHEAVPPVPLAAEHERSLREDRLPKKHLLRPSAETNTKEPLNSVDVYMPVRSRQ